MKLTMFLLIGACLQVSANAYSQKINLSANNVSLEKIFRQIKSQSDYLFFYDHEVIKKSKAVTIRVQDAGIEEVLAACFKDQPLQYTITNKIIIVKPRSEPIAKPAPPLIDIRGTVKDDAGKPLAGATIKLKGTNKGVATDAEGNFSLQVPETGGILVISYIGFNIQEIPIGPGSDYNIVLRRTEARIDEVVVVGYGTRNRSDLTGAVSSVSNKDFQDQPVTRLDQVLQGRSTGVQVTSSSGSPGGDVRIRIRGANSLTGDNSPLYVVDGFVGADFNNINAEDIAAITVLKDAASTAIYGSRGANGVIIVTTKSGRSGAMKVDVMSRISTSNVIGRYDVMNAADFAQVVNERAQALTPAGSTYTPRFTDEQIAEFKRTGGTDWQDAIFRPALGQEYQLGFSGGSEKTTYFINSNYLDQQGIVDNSDFKRYSLRTNLSSKISDKFSLRLNFTGVRRENHNTSGTGARSASLGQALAWAPTTPIYASPGIYTIKDPTSSIFQNPVAINRETDNRNDNTNLNLIGGLRYDIIRDLTLDVQFGVSYTNTQSKGFQGPAITGNNPSASRYSSETILLQNTNNLTYKKVFDDVHALEITGVFETQKSMSTGFRVGVAGLTYPNQSYNNIALSASSQVSSGYGEWGLLSLLGRVNYAYKDKYLLTASLRRDGSSKFQGSNKYSMFPSAAVGWKISEEAFMRDQDVFNSIKLRASWGLTGNQGINPYGTLSAYNTNLDDAGNVFDGASGNIVSGIALGNPGNPDLKWETTEQINVGADIEVLRGAISFSADYFIKKTRDLLLSEPLPGYLGGYSILSNVGDMQNKGWEFSLGIDPHLQGSFKWSSFFNISFLDNKLISLGKDRTDIRFDAFILKPGSPIGSFFGYQYLGTWKPKEAAEAAGFGLKPGDARYADTNGDGVVNDADYQIIGNALPKTSLGWNNTFTYNRFSLNVFIQGLMGLDKLNYSYAFGMLGSTDAKEILFNDIKDRYIPGVNETSDIPAFSSAPSNSYSQSSRFIENASFVRLKNVSLSYAINKPILKVVKSFKVFVSATNLATITKYKGIDPESNSNAPEGLNYAGFVSDTQQGLDQGAYPNAKVYTAGVTLSF